MLGLSVGVIWLVYFISAFGVRFGTDTMPRVGDGTESVQGGWVLLLGFIYILGMLAWMLGSVAHAVSLGFRGQPSRRTALVPLDGMIVMIATSLLSISIGGESSPYAGQKNPDNMIMFAVIAAPLIVQILDLVLPPWKSAPRVVAKLVPRSEW